MSKSTKQTTEQKPPAWAVPLFTKSADEAMKLYDSGAGGGVYKGPTVAGLTGTTRSGINMLNNTGSSGLASTSNRLLNGIATGKTGISTGSQYQDAIKAASGKSAAEQYLTSYARGDNLTGEGNPFYRQRLEKEIADSNALIQSQFAGAGRFGSGANQNTIADNTSNMLLSGLESDWNREQQNQFNAVNAIDAGRNTQMGNRLAAISGLTGVQGQNISNRLSASGAMLDAKNTDYQNRLRLADARIGAGQVQQANDQAKLQADYSKWLATDMQDWTRLGLLQSAAAGAAGNYGTNTQTATQPFNPLSGLGAIASLFPKSDARAKWGIVPLGVEHGHVIYEFSYLGSRARFRGVMAQQVAERDPLAVIIDTDGLYAVDYRRIGLEMRAA